MGKKQSLSAGAVDVGSEVVAGTEGFTANEIINEFEQASASEGAGVIPLPSDVPDQMAISKVADLEDGGEVVAGVSSDGREIAGVRMPIPAEETTGLPIAPNPSPIHAGWKCPDPPKSVDRINAGVLQRDDLGRVLQASEQQFNYDIAKFIGTDLFDQIRQKANGNGTHPFNYLAENLFVAFEHGGFDCLAAEGTRDNVAEADKNSFEAMFMQRLLGPDIFDRLERAAIERSVPTLAALKAGIQTCLNKGYL